ncbi:MAG TPA: SdpI family protein [Terriglobales bacterium]|nr:SdpI family protein [Terriglobales bacterium]
MRFSWRTEWPQWLLIAAMFALAAATWGRAPERIPVHWGIGGQVDRWGGRFEGLLAIPLLALGIYVLMLIVPRIDPGRANYDAFVGPYTTLRLSILVVMAGLYALVILWVRGMRLSIEVLVPLLVGALFVVVGNVLGKLRPNWFVGIRTPWTLSSKQSWTRTHRAGGWVFVLMGVLMMLCAALRTDWALWTMIAVSLVSILGLIVYSYLIWLRDPDKVPPAGTQPAPNDSRP